MRSLMLGTVATLALAAGAQAQADLVIEGTEAAPDDLLGKTVYAAGEGARGATGETGDLSDVPKGWVAIGVIEELTPPGGGIEIVFAPEMMEEDDAVSAKVSAERLRLIPDRDDPEGGYFVLLDVAGTPLAEVLEDAGHEPMPAAGEAEVLGEGATTADGAELAPEPDPDVVVVETEPDADAEPLREVDITDPDAPPIEDATNVVPEGDPSDEAVVPEIAAETEMTSPSHTAAMPALGTTSPAIAPEEFTLVDASTMDPTQLLKVRVYSADGDNIGEIDRWVGEPPEAAVVDVGGFLGLGDREVAIGTGLLTLMASADGNDMRIYVEMTEAEIEGLPAID